ncbi:cerebellar degeneration-related protein 2-like [Hippocampus zosterae]|uniref:cerebellar degeneration-related protein 2-like n=1 Tax=Hippocampus zosterae TaxID=109293 RepID=UPI00223CEB64|nr:cerebellar degeneration-related protein 2-like [Hippocampus zosterae]XP_051925684.1 cerebellar degeneration-related protein 2-like [Hippocampus zosterae]XP_051925685.1 cerebellar degeneration-related protein 2-like [Hippocampus zosterae]
MLSVEEEFELKEEEPWYDKQDLEQDLQLAAELGKSLLEKNRELEQSLQQMYSTNQEQVQEIEYLAKQVELLRQVNDQHAKAYEQLDVASRELEQSNRTLTRDNRAAQHKIRGLTETVDQLQTRVDELQREADDVKSQVARGDRQRWRGGQSLEQLPKLRRCDDDDPEEAHLGVDWRDGVRWWHEEQQASLCRSLRSLQAQYAGERARREEAEREAGLLSGQNQALERQLAGMETFRLRVSELEREAEELRHLRKSQSFSQLNVAYAIPEEEAEVERDGEAEPSGRRPLKRRASERLLRAERECRCAQRSAEEERGGISLLNEVDAQYSALRVKYEELLRHFALQQRHREEPRHEAVQTAERNAGFRQPEYKELFREIFARIQKTKEDLENRARQGHPAPEDKKQVEDGL